MPLGALFKLATARGSPALLMKTSPSRSGTTETPLKNEDRRAGCRPESPRVRENPARRSLAWIGPLKYLTHPHQDLTQPVLATAVAAIAPVGVVYPDHSTKAERLPDAPATVLLVFRNTKCLLPKILINQVILIDRKSKLF